MDYNGIIQCITLDYRRKVRKNDSLSLNYDIIIKIQYYVILGQSKHKLNIEFVCKMNTNNYTREENCLKKIEIRHNLRIVI